MGKIRSITDIGPKTKLCALIGNPVSQRDDMLVEFL